MEKVKDPIGIILFEVDSHRDRLVSTVLSNREPPSRERIAVCITTQLLVTIFLLLKNETKHSRHKI